MEVAQACGFASGDELREEFADRYKFDVDKMAAQRPRGPHLARK